MHKAFYLNQFEIIVRTEKDHEEVKEIKEFKAETALPARVLTRNESVPLHATLDLTYKAMMIDMDVSSLVVSPNS